MRLIKYNEHEYSDTTYHDVHDVINAISLDKVNWIDMGVSCHEAVSKIGECLNLHHLLIDDIINESHLPRFENFEAHYFLSVKMLYLVDEDHKLQEEHLSIILGKNVLVTFQEDLNNDVFDPVRDRIFKNLGRIRKNGADYLFYRLLDAVTNTYNEILEEYRDKIEIIEMEVIKNPECSILEDITHLKSNLSLMRKYILPFRDELNKLRSDHSELVQKSTFTYLRDVTDNLSYLLANFETFRDMLKDLIDLQMATLSRSMNDIMKTLTVISTIFIPLTFIVGVYGMNFEFMPETHWAYGYYMALGGMFALGIAMYLYMKYRKWV